MKVTLINGGGAGCDQVPAVQRILAAAGVAIDWDEHQAGLAALERGQTLLPEEMMCSVRTTGLALKTKLLSPPGPELGNANVQAAESWASMPRFARSRTCGLPARHQGVDLLVMRELTEDLYAAIEHEIVPGVVQSLKVVTEAACRRFFQFAFTWARAVGRKIVHCVHKANIIKMADGLILETFRGRTILPRPDPERNHRRQLLHADGPSPAAV